ncbi:MAG: right-handed parallel beta-helix repeat-containing protein [Planctomycetota bacterium]|jgi:hypothetical protein|nr:right-handed parallel beta-helix repeat-containing protein [Planctomycetota bacterium]
MSLWCGLGLSMLALTPQGESMFHGAVPPDTTWRDTVRLDGDVEVPEGTILRVAAGTRVVIEPSDVTRGGWNPRHIEIHVKGNLIVMGARDKPVTIGTSAAPARGTTSAGTEGSWHGIILYPGTAGAVPRIRHCHFLSAYSAIQIPDGDAEIFGCLFMGCVTGIEVGSAYRDYNNRGMKGGKARPMIESCRFADCWTGVFAERNGSPTIHRSIFARCQIAVGNRRSGTSGPLELPGTILDRCDILHCRNGVLGPTVISNSIFGWNGKALQPSGHHSPHMTRIDQVAYRANLFFKNEHVLTGESGIGMNAFEADPGFVGSPTAATRLGPALLPELALKPDSPARKRATDGGDLGAVGELSIDVTGNRWVPNGHTIDRMIVIRSKDTKIPSKAPRTKPLGPTIGKAVGKSWWAVPRLGEQGTIRLKDVFGGIVPGGYAAAILQASAPGEASLEINGDLKQLVVWWNGKKLHSLEKRRRFHESGIILDVKAKAGENKLILWVMGWGQSPVLGIACEAGRDVAITEEGLEAPTEPLAITGTKILREKRARYLQISVNRATNWTYGHGSGAVRLLDAGGKDLADPQTLPLLISTTTKLRIPLPNGIKKPFFLKLQGTRDAWGRPQPELPLHKIE